jgi:bifunctional UDP-N-acetylglucosamine pyrophosphorylase/glucosamine-1-phosphate N-acetyltransferase
MTDSPSQPAAILLAAGKGTRMGSDLAKVLHPVAGEPMLHWVIAACRAAGAVPIVVVVGYQAEQVKAAFAGQPDVRFVHQDRQLGTGHAAKMAAPLLADHPGEVFVLNGDGPLIRPETLHALLDTHRRAHAAGTLATARLDDPTGYGRVIRDADGGLAGIVEQKDATPEQLAVQEVNPNYLCYTASALFDALDRLSDDNAQGEYYLTDVPRLVREAGGTIAIVDAVPAEDVLGINTPEQLAQVDAILRGRLGTSPPASPPEATP